MAFTDALTADIFPDALSAIGYDTDDKHIAFVRFMHLAGVFSPEGEAISKEKARAFIKKPVLPPVSDSQRRGNPTADCIEYINILGQARFKVLRGNGECQQSQPDPVLSGHHELALSLLKALGMADAIVPDDNDLKDTDCFLNLGATQETIEKRTAFLKRQLDRRAAQNPEREATVYLLGGARDLWPETSLRKDDGVTPAVNGEPLALQLFAERILKAYGPRFHASMDEIASHVQTSIVDRHVQQIGDIGVKETRKNIVTEAVAAYKVAWPNESDLQLRVAETMNIAENGVTIKVVYGDVAEGKGRPDTATTAKAFIALHAENHDNIYVISTQPHVERQIIPFAQQLPGKNISPAAPEIKEGNAGIQQGAQECLARINAVMQQAIAKTTSHVTHPDMRSAQTGAFHALGRL